MRPLTATLLLALLCCTSCAASRRVSFDPAAYERFASKGTGVVDGHASVQDETGAWHGIAGREVTLQPVTPYSQEWFQRAVIGDEELLDPDPGLTPYLRTVVADANGAFRFPDLSAGDYFLTCRVTWTTAGLEGRFVMHGAWLQERLSVPAGGTVHVDLGPERGS